MPLVTVKPKYQVTIPAKLRKGLNLREGDVMEATVVGDGILLRLKDVVDRGTADRVAAILEAVERTPEDARRSEDEIMAEVIADIAEAAEGASCPARVRVVIDCNVVVSAARSHGVCGRVVVEALGRHRVALAEDIVREYRRLPSVPVMRLTATRCYPSSQSLNRPPSSSSRTTPSSACAIRTTRSTCARPRPLRPCSLPAIGAISPSRATARSKCSLHGVFSNRPHEPDRAASSLVVEGQ